MNSLWCCLIVFACFNFHFANGQTKIKKSRRNSREDNPKKIGCFRDEENLIGEHIGIKGKDYRDCAARCGALGYPYIGFKNEQNCFCNTILPEGENRECTGHVIYEISYFKERAAKEIEYQKDTNRPIYFGCYAFGNEEKLKNYHYHIIDKDNSPKNCSIVCASGRYYYAGVALKTHCYCFDEIELKQPDRVCRKSEYMCPGNNSVYCGGYYTAAVYVTHIASDYADVDPKTAAEEQKKKDKQEQADREARGKKEAESPNGPKYIGCYTNRRTIDDTLNVTEYSFEEQNSPELCAKICAMDGTFYFALYSKQYCICSNRIFIDNTKESEDHCMEKDTTRCEGDPSVFCGGRRYFSVYATHLAPNYG